MAKAVFTNANASTSAAWVDTGLDIKQGQRIFIQAGGKMSWQSGNPLLTPDGTYTPPPGTDGGDYIWPYQKFCMLIGYIGSISNLGTFQNSGSGDAGGKFIAIGSRYTKKAVVSGRLYLCVNDRYGYFWDNSGRFTVSITLGSANDGASCPISPGGFDKVVTVNPLTLYAGEKQEQATDLTVNTPAGPLTFTRSYRQRKQHLYQFMGLGWSHNHNILLTKIPGSDTDVLDTIKVSLPEGGEAHFTQVDKDANANLYQGDAGSTSSISWDGTQYYTLTAEDKSQYIFLASVDGTTGQLTQRLWPNGEYWNYSYYTDPGIDNGKLMKVEDSGYALNAAQLKRSLNFSYYSLESGPFQGLLYQVTDHTGRYIELHYENGKYIDPQGNISSIGLTIGLLSSVRDVQGNTWTYLYYGQQVNETNLQQLNLLTGRQSPMIDIVGNGIANHISTLESVSYTLQGVELALNGDMETDGNWSGLYSTTTARVTTPVHTGTYSRSVVTSVSGTQGIQGDPWNMKLGKSYLVTAWVYPTSYTTGRVTMQLSSDPSVQVTSGGINAWELLNFTYTPTTNFYGCQLQFVTQHATTFYVDTVSITELSVSNVQQQRGDGLLTATLTFQPAGQNVTTETVAGRQTVHQFEDDVYAGAQNALGNVTSQSTDAQYRLSAQTDANGHQTLMNWSNDGKHLNQVIDPLGHQISFSYNATNDNSDNTLSHSIDSQGRTTQYTYGTPGTTTARLPVDLKIYDSDSRTILRWQQFTYDNRGRTLTEKTLDPATGVVQQLVTRTYYLSGSNGAGLLYQIIQNDLLNPANNLTTTYMYDAAGRIMRTNQSATFGSCIASFTLYDPVGNVLANICNYDPGSGADPVSIAGVIALYNPGNPDKNQVTVNTYDSLNRRILTTSNAGATYAQTTLTVYDALNRVIRTISNYVATPAILDPYIHSRNDFQHGLNNDQNLVTETTYNERGLVATQTDVLGNVTLYGYDDADRPIKTVQSASQPSYNNLYTSGDPRLSHYVAGSSPDQDIITTSQYDAIGNLVASTDVLGNMSLIGYDPLNRPVKTIRSASQLTYNVAADPTLNHYVPSGAPDQDLVEITQYDSLGHVLIQQDVLGNVTLYGYDSLGRSIKTIRNASRTNYNMTADPTLNQYLAVNDPDLDIITLTVYDSIGRVSYTTDALGRRTWSVYDGLGRVIRTIANAVGTATDGGPNDPRSASYIASSDPDKDISTQTVYDTNGYVLYTQDALGRQTWFAYDSRGRQIRTIVNPTHTATDGSINDPRSPNYIPGSNPDQDIITQTAYDSQGRVLYTQDALGRRTWYVYDLLGRTIKTIVNAVGMATDGGIHDPRTINYGTCLAADKDLTSQTNFDLAGRVIWTMNALSNRTWYAYDRLGRTVKTVQNAVGTATDGSVTDPRSPVYLVSGNPDQDVTSQTVYNKGGQVTVTTDTLGNQTHFSYDHLGRSIQTIANFVTGTFNANRPDQDLTSVTSYDQGGRVLTTVDVRGTQTTFTYNQVGRSLTVTQAAGTPQAVTTYTCYDKAGQVLRTIQNWTNDPTQPSPDARDTRGNWLFKPTLHGGANDQNLISTYTLDLRGRWTVSSDPLGNTTQMTYYLDGQSKSMTDPLGVVTQYRYDLARRRTLVVTSYTATSLSDPATWTWNAAASRWQDAQGTPIPAGTANDQNIVVQTTYDQAGRMLALRDPRGNRSTYTYDLLNRRTSLTDPLAHAWNTAYLNSNNLLQTTVTDPLGNVTQQTADALGRVKAIQYLGESPKLTPDVSILYDKSGNRLRMTETAGGATPVRAANFSYDQAHRLNQVTFDVHGDGATLQTVGYRYDPGGLRTQLTLPGNLSLNYQYNPRGQMTALTDWSSQQTTYNYDKVGRPTAINRSNGLLSQYGYDPAGRLQRLRHSTGTRLVGQFDYTIDARGNRTQVTETVAQNTLSTSLAYNDASIAYYLGSWAAAAPFMVSTDVSAALRIPFSNDQITLTMGTGSDHSLYDVYLDGDLWSTQDGYAATTGTQSVTIALSGYRSHRLEVRNRPDKSLLSSGYKVRFQSLTLAGQRYDWQTLRYSYDNLARLTQAATYPGGSTGGTPSRQYNYQYDVAGNRAQQVVTVSGTPTTTNYTCDAANRLQSDGTHSYTYDTAGRLTNDGVNAYTWDRANRLLTYNGTANQYAYDGDGHRVQQTVAGLVTQYVIDVQPGLAKVVAATTSGNTIRHVHDPMGIHQQQNADTTWHWSVKDGLGSVRGEVDSSVNQQESRQYGPYGELTQTSGSSQSVFGYTGEETDPGTGLVNLRARYYNPTLGQFMGLDPLEGTDGQPMSLNRYSYVQGNVINWVDPSGMYTSPNPGQYDTCNNNNGQNSCPSNPIVDYSLFPKWGAKLTVDSGLQGVTQVLVQGQKAEPICWKQEHKDYLEAAFGVIEQRLTAKAGTSFSQVFGAIEFRYVPSSEAAGLTPVKYGGNLVELSTNLISGQNGVAINRTARRHGVRDVGGLYGFSITPASHCVAGSTASCNSIERTIVHELGHAFDYRTGRSMFLYADSNHSALPVISTTSSSFASFCEHCDSGDVSEIVADHFLNWVYDSYIGVDLNNFPNNTGAFARRISAYWLGGMAFDEPFQPNNPKRRPATPGIKAWAKLASIF